MDTPRTHPARHLSPAEHLAVPVWMPPVTQETAHLARLPTEEELRVRRVTAALRKRLNELTVNKETAR